MNEYRIVGAKVVQDKLSVSRTTIRELNRHTIRASLVSIERTDGKHADGVCVTIHLEIESFLIIPILSPTLETGDLQT